MSVLLRQAARSRLNVHNRSLRHACQRQDECLGRGQLDGDDVADGHALAQQCALAAAGVPEREPCTGPLEAQASTSWRPGLVEDENDVAGRAAPAFQRNRESGAGRGFDEVALCVLGEQDFERVWAGDANDSPARSLIEGEIVQLGDFTMSASIEAGRVPWIALI